MPRGDPKTIAEMWWKLNDERLFADAAALCSPECVIDWPLSDERFASADDWAAAMEHYPGVWRCTVQTLIVDGDRSMTIAEVANASASFTAISIFRIRDGRIAGLVEYWPEPYDAPSWRAEWVTPISTTVDTHI